MTNFTKAELKERDATYAASGRRRDAYQKFLMDYDPQAFVTLAINHGAKRLESNKEKLATWAYHVDCALNKKPRRITRLKPAKRLQGWFVAEKQDTNSHWHGLVIFPEGFATNAWRNLQLATIFDYQWQKFVPSGNVETKPIYNTAGAAGYCLKEFHKGDDFFGSLVELADFWPVSKPGRRR